MRRILEAGIFSIGVILFLLGISLKLPYSLIQVHLLMGTVFKTALIVLGLVVMVLPVVSFFSEKGILAHQKFRASVINDTILLGSLLVSFVLLEILLHVTMPSGCRIPDEIMHHTYQPGCSYTFRTSEWSTQVHINSGGLRDDEPLANPDFRILVLGSSFVRGYGVEQNETFPELLQRKFNEAGAKTEVINAGITSYSPILEYLYLKYKGLSYKPDMIILTFDMADLNSDFEFEKIAVFDNDALVSVPSGKTDSLLEYIYLKLRTPRLIESLLSRVAISPKAPPNDVRYDKYAITREEISLNESAHWNRSFSYIGKIKNLSNATFILISYPYGHQVSGTEWGEGRRNYGFEPGKIYSSRADNILREYAKRNNIPYISLFDAFRESNEPGLYFPYDGHFTAAGHALAADVLFKELNT